MIPLPQRLALQVGLIFCLIAAALGLAKQIGAPTVILRAVLCGLAGGGIGAGIGTLLLWLKDMADNLPELPAEAPSEALPALAKAPASPPAVSEGPPHG